MQIFQTLLELLVIVALVAANGFFVAAEFALVKIRASQLQPMIKTGGWGVKFALRAPQDLRAALTATQLGFALAIRHWSTSTYHVHAIKPEDS